MNCQRLTVARVGNESYLAVLPEMTKIVISDSIRQNCILRTSEMGSEEHMIDNESMALGCVDLCLTARQYRIWIITCNSFVRGNAASS